MNFDHFGTYPYVVLMVGVLISWHVVVVVLAFGSDLLQWCHHGLDWAQGSKGLEEHRGRTDWKWRLLTEWSKQKGPLSLCWANISPFCHCHDCDACPGTSYLVSSWSSPMAEAQQEERKGELMWENHENPNHVIIRGQNGSWVFVCV